MRTILSLTTIIVACFSLNLNLLGQSVKSAKPTTQRLVRMTLGDANIGESSALTLLVPEKWSVSGGPKWYPAFVHQVSFELTIRETNGLAQVQMFPTYWFTHSTDNPYPPKPLDPYMGQVWLEPYRPVDLLELITIPGFRTAEKPRITQREELKELARYFARSDGQSVEAGRVRIEYTINGQPVEEDFYIVTTYYRLRTQGGVITTWSPALMPFAVRAARGMLDTLSPTLLATAFSIQPTPSYFKAIRIAQTRAIGNMARMQELDRQDAREIFKTREDINAIYREMWNARNKSNQRTFETRQDLLGGVAPYSGGNSNYLLPNTHKFQWVSQDGKTVILTDDINLDPNINSSSRWERLKEMKR